MAVGSARRAEAALVEAAREGGVRDARVLDAVGRVPRTGFVRPAFVEVAGIDGALPIGYGQTTSQPSLIAAMVESLHIEATDRVLEVGTGLGYETAILSLLAREVFSVEYFPELAQCARKNLHRFGARNTHIVAGDGGLGLPRAAPFDAIVICAAFPEVPRPLVDQLGETARLVQPVGPGGREEVIVHEKRGGEFRTIGMLTLAAFVPLRGEYGYRSLRPRSE